MYKKGNIVLLLLMVVAAFVIVYYLISHNQKESRNTIPVTPTASSLGEGYEWKKVTDAESDWVTYTDPEGILSLKHPKEWERDKENPALFYVAPECIHCGGIRSYIFFNIEKNKDKLNSYDYAVKVSNETYDGADTNKLVSFPKSLSIYDITMIDGIFGAGDPGPNFYIVWGDWVISIESDGVGFDTLSKIISTLEIKQ